MKTQNKTKQNKPQQNTEKIFAKHIYDKALVSRMDLYPEYIKHFQTHW